MRDSRSRRVGDRCSRQRPPFDLSHRGATQFQRVGGDEEAVQLTDGIIEGTHAEARVTRVSVVPDTR